MVHCQGKTVTYPQAEANPPVWLGWPACSLSFTLAGDWQASPSPEWRVNQRANKAHNNALRDAFFRGGGDDEMEQTAGAVVPLHLRPVFTQR